MAMARSVLLGLAMSAVAGMAFAAPPGDDGWSQRYPAARRFELVMDGKAVLDRETGLVWLQQAGDLGGSATMDWRLAVDNCYAAHWGTGRKGWRLPTVEELGSLVAVGPAPTYQAGLPAGHPFNLGGVNGFWTITNEVAVPFDTTRAMVVNFANGAVGADFKVNGHGVWCVRGGNGHNPTP